jgi:hypothetical protein
MYYRQIYAVGMRVAAVHAISATTKAQEEKREMQQQPCP